MYFDARRSPSGLPIALAEPPPGRACVTPEAVGGSVDHERPVFAVRDLDTRFGRAERLRPPRVEAFLFFEKVAVRVFRHARNYELMRPRRRLREHWGMSADGDR